MVKFTIKCLLLASLFFFGVLYGIQEASQGMQEMQGTHQAHAPKVEQPASTPADVSLSKKEETLQHIQTFNVFSALGDITSNVVTGIFQTGVNAATSLLNNALS